MDIDLKLKNKLEEHRNQVLKKARICLFGNCHKKADGSHVLQVNGILNEIIDATNHFYSIKHKPLFYSSNGDTFKVERIGIINGYKFPGFCREHDDKLFKEIETHPINLTRNSALALFSYRACCLAVRQNQILSEILDGTNRILRECRTKYYFNWQNEKDEAVKDLEFYKSQLEDEIANNGARNFEYELLRLPKQKMCLSSMVSTDRKDGKTESKVDKYGMAIYKPWPISILNYFPYNGASWLIIATHKQYPCEWGRNLSKQIKAGKDSGKAISDLVTYRADFWAMSPEIYERLPKETLRKFLAEMHRVGDNYDFNIESDFNLFAN